MEPAPLPLFPLESVVLFPTVRCPLHVFEPRYRDMTRAALAGDGRIGMVAVRPGHAAEMAGNPPVFDVGCEGVIRESRELPDGRFNILLEGTWRFRIRREWPAPPVDGRLYRVAEIEPLEDPLRDDDLGALRALRGEVVETVSELVRRVAPKRVDALARSLDGVSDVTFVNALCQSVDFAPLEKQGLLECPGILKRCEQLRDLVRFRLLDASGGMSGPRETLH